MSRRISNGRGKTVCLSSQVLWLNYTTFLLAELGFLAGETHNPKNEISGKASWSQARQ